MCTHLQLISASCRQSAGGPATLLQPTCLTGGKCNSHTGASTHSAQDRRHRSRKHASHEMPTSCCIDSHPHLPVPGLQVTPWSSPGQFTGAPQIATQVAAPTQQEAAKPPIAISNLALYRLGSRPRKKPSGDPRSRSPCATAQASSMA